MIWLNFTLLLRQTRMLRAGPVTSARRTPPGLNNYLPRGSIYTTIMELGPQNHNGDGLLGPNSIIVVYMDPLGYTILGTLNPKSKKESPYYNY